MRLHFSTSLLMALTGLVILLTGCSQRSTNPSLGHTTPLAAQDREFASSDQHDGHTYHYYPSIEVYYAPDRDTYFWKASAYWGVGRRLPSTYKLDASERQVITLESSRPYRVHDKVLARFPNPESAGVIASVSTDRD